MSYNLSVVVLRRSHIEAEVLRMWKKWPLNILDNDKKKIFLSFLSIRRESRDYNAVHIMIYSWLLLCPSRRSIQ